MKTMIFPGSFDPFTLGHLDIVQRAAEICDRLIIAVMTNRGKKPVFSSDERIKIISESIQKCNGNIEILYYDGLLVNLYKEVSASAVVRGIRSESDFRAEAEMVAANRLQYAPFEVVLLPCSIMHAYTSSSIVKEIASYGGDISAMIAPSAMAFVKEKISYSVQTLKGGEAK